MYTYIDLLKNKYIFEISKIDNKYWINLDVHLISGWSYYSHTSLTEFKSSYAYPNELKKYVEKFIKNIIFL